MVRLTNELGGTLCFTELTMPDKSSLQQERIAYVPDVPPVLQAEHVTLLPSFLFLPTHPHPQVSMKIGSETTAADDSGVQLEAWWTRLIGPRLQMQLRRNFHCFTANLSSLSSKLKSRPMQLHLSRCALLLC